MTSLVPPVPWVPERIMLFLPSNKYIDYSQMLIDFVGLRALYVGRNRCWLKVDLTMA